MASESLVVSGAMTFDTMRCVSAKLTLVLTSFACPSSTRDNQLSCLLVGWKNSMGVENLGVQPLAVGLLSRRSTSKDDTPTKKLLPLFEALSLLLLLQFLPSTLETLPHSKVKNGWHESSIIDSVR